MPGKKFYLKQNVMIEPLFNQWYAWAYLMAPVQAAMYTANLHLKIMRSFIANPQLHMSAVKNPAMLGGPFINYDHTRINDIKALIERIEKEQSHVLELAEAIKNLDNTLSNEASGYSLEPLYEKVPAFLKGYVELGYDLNNHPSIRFLEGLLYKSRYFDPALQSIALSETNRDGRPFILSTPMLEDEGLLHLKLPFDHKGVDALAKARLSPCSLSEMQEALSISDEKAELFTSFFTEQAPSQPQSYKGDGLQIRYFGHACLLIETKDVSILTDPVISYKYDTELPRYTYCDLPETIDYVLITHSHSDHFILETLLQLRHRIKNVIVPRSLGGVLIDPSLKLILQNIGFQNVRELDEMEVIEISEGSITGLPFFGEHADLHIRSKIAYLVDLKGSTMIFAADSNNIEPKLYERIHDLVGDIDILFLGMECVGAPLTWSYGPLLTKPLARKMDQSRRFNGSNSEKAMVMVEQLNARQVYVYAMGEEPWLTHLTSLQYTEASEQIIESNRLLDQCKRLNLVAERLFGKKDISLMAR
ncbi:MAG: MBL fold metallo-hydrolase [Blastocatellia bacterium]